MPDRGEIQRRQLIQDVLGRVYADLPHAVDLTPRQWETFAPEARGRIMANYLLQIEQTDQPVAKPLKAMMERGDYKGLAEAFGQSLETIRREKTRQMILSSTPHGFRGLTKEEEEAYIQNVRDLFVALGVID